MTKVYSTAIVAFACIMLASIYRDTYEANMDALEFKHDHAWSIWTDTPELSSILNQHVQSHTCIRCGLQEYRNFDKATQQ
jgi:hypothetical protein